MKEKGLVIVAISILRFIVILHVRAITTVSIINISALKLPIPTNHASMFKLAIKEHFESH